MGMKEMTRFEFRLWPERQDVVLQVPEAASPAGSDGSFSSYTLAYAGGAVRRRAVKAAEHAPSAGAYLHAMANWLIPDAVMPDGLTPTPGCRIVEQDDDQTTWTLLRVVTGKFGNTHTCEAINLKLAFNLRARGTLSRPTAARSGSGLPTLGAYATVATDIPCRVQPEGGAAEDALGKRQMPQRFTAYIQAQVIPRAKDKFESDGATYSVVEVRNPERLDELPQLVLEQVV